MSIQDDENTCKEGSKGCSWGGIAFSGAATTSADRACADLSPSGGSIDKLNGNHKTNQYKPNPGAAAAAALNNGH